jgi:hypothetical protein
MNVEVNPAPGQPLPRWEPANDVERRLNAVVAVEDFDEAMRILMAAPLVLPGFDEADESAADRPGQRVLVREREGVPYLLVFTSVEAMQRAVSAEGWRETSMDELVRAWPELSPATPMGLAINPTTPILMLVDPENVPLMTSPPSDPRREFEPANVAESALREALVGVDGQLLLDVLVISRVIVFNDGLEFDGVPTVAVFTSRQRCDEYLAQTGLEMATVSMDMVALLGNWPGAEYQLAVNPGSPIAFVLDGSRIPGMLGYAGDLIRERLGGAKDGSGRPAPDRSTTLLVATPGVPADRTATPESATSHDHAPAHGTSPDHVVGSRHADPDDRTHPDDDDSPIELPADGRVADFLRGWN